MRSVEQMISASRIPQNQKVEIISEVEQKRKKNYSKEYEICLFVQEVLREAELNRCQTISSIVVKLQQIDINVLA